MSLANREKRHIQQSLDCYCDREEPEHETDESDSSCDLESKSGIHSRDEEDGPEDDREYPCFWSADQLLSAVTPSECSGDVDDISVEEGRQAGKEH